MSAIRTSAALLLFALLTALASASAAHRADYAVTVWLQHAAPAADTPATIFVLLGNAEIVISIAALAGLVVLVQDRRRGLDMLAFAGGLAAISLLAVILKHIIPHPGPPPWLQRHVFSAGLSLHQTSSFPSGHTVRATLLAAMLPRRYRPGAGLLVLCMMAVLVYLGDHWASDVLGGLCLGWAGVEAARGLQGWRRGRPRGAPLRQLDV